jgi:arylsulfatase A-like enzyme
MLARLSRVLWSPILLGLALPGLCRGEPEPARRPNILFLLADDQRNDTLGCAGHPIIKTPNIDRLAARGVRFENMFVTTAICWVSRATILTGEWARTHGQPTNMPHPTAESLAGIYPRHLRAAGYRTGFFGKWHTQTPPGFRPEDQFDEYEYIFRNPYIKTLPDGTKRHEAQLIADRALDFLAGQDPNQPFCLNLWFNTAHAEDGDKRPGIGHFPWPATVDGLYEDVTIPPPRLSDPAIYESQPEFLKQSINRERFFWRWDTPEKYQTNMRAYFRMITGLDYEIGRVLRALEERGLADKTIVVYSADNGYYMGNRGFAGKWSHYEESIRVPLIIHDPRLPQELRGRVLPAFALNVDLPATFLDWAGVPIPSTYQGRSLAPLVEAKPPADWRRSFFVEHPELPPLLTWEGIRGERHVYARYVDQRPVFEFLHDLQTDPDELKNLATDPAHAATLAEFRARCDALVAQYGGPLKPLDERRSAAPKKAQAKKAQAKKASKADTARKRTESLYAR